MILYLNTTNYDNINNFFEVDLTEKKINYIIFKMEI